MRGVLVAVVLALLAGCVGETAEPLAPPDVAIIASDCRLLQVVDAQSAPVEQVEPFLPPGAVALASESGHARLTLSVLACDTTSGVEAGTTGLAWAWLAADLASDGSRQLVIEHWAPAGRWSDALAARAAPTPVHGLAFDVDDGALVAHAANATTHLRIAMPTTTRDAAPPAALVLVFPTGAHLDLALDATGPTRATIGAFELPAESVARELLGPNGVRAGTYATALAAQGTLRSS